jgi:PAS domain S-box-containing protein
MDICDLPCDDCGMPRSSSVPLPEELIPFLDSLIDAVIVLADDGRVAGWNSVAEETFGWPLEHANGRMLSDLIIPPQYRQAHEQGMRRVMAGGSPHVLNKRIELPASRSDGTEIPVELSITRRSIGGATYFIGLMRDISDRRRAEQLLEQKLTQNQRLLEITQMSAEADSFDDALRMVLKAICEMTVWDAGHAFLVDDSNAGLLHASSIWHETTPDIALAMKQQTTGLSLPSGKGLPGHVLETGQPLWLEDIATAPEFTRSACDFHGAFAFPLKTNGQITAVLEFFSATPQPPDQALLLFARALGDQLGRVIERLHTAERLALLVGELNHRIKNSMTMIQAVAQLTFRDNVGAADQLEVFTERLAALGRAQDLISRDHQHAPTLGAVIAAALEGFTAFADRITVAGPEVPVTAAQAHNQVLTVHELCTNALKYGALAVEQGRVSITWGYHGDGAARTFQFDWQETGCKLTGGPPPKKGFGSNLIKRGLASAPGRDLKIEYTPSGVHYQMKMPAPELPAPELPGI